MADVAAVEAVEPVRRRRRRHASASGNNGGDNDSSDEDVAKERSSFKVPPSLEDAAIDAYLTYLESEVVAYIGLTQTDSKVLRGVTARMLASLKAQINSTMSGIASSVIRQKMLKIILSDRFPSPQYCNMFIGKPDDDEDDEVAHLPRQGLYSNCPNSCCTGAFIQEAMAGIIMSADIHELIFTNESVNIFNFFPKQNTSSTEDVFWYGFRQQNLYCLGFTVKSAYFLIFLKNLLRST